MFRGEVTDVIWTCKGWCLSYLQIANEFKWKRAFQMVLILGNSFGADPHDRNTLMSFLRRKPRLQCLSSRTISYIVSEMIELLWFFVCCSMILILRNSRALFSLLCVCIQCTHMHSTHTMTFPQYPYLFISCIVLLLCC